jgi:hypothetical protein
MKRTRIIHHGILESGRWFKMPLVEQMANVGADVGRAVQWKENDDEVASK